MYTIYSIINEMSKFARKKLDEIHPEEDER